MKVLKHWFNKFLLDIDKSKYISSIGIHYSSIIELFRVLSFYNSKELSNKKVYSYLNRRIYNFYNNK
jgi:hypothetical protein